MASEESRSLIEARIKDLEPALSLGPNDVLLLDTEDGTYKITGSTLASALKILGSYALSSDIPNVPNWALQATKPSYSASEVGAVSTADVANNLTTTAAGKVLDARQGSALKALVDAVQAALNLSILVGSTTTIAAGTSTVSLTGLTADHVVCFWGFSSGGENDPPADITVTTAANSYTITVSNVSSSGVTMTPVFIKPQN